MAQANPGESPADTQAGTRSHQNMSDNKQTKEPIEKKHLADDATGRPEPSANPERAPQHQPGYEAKHEKEAAKDDPNKRHKQGAQADEATARNQANDDLDAQEAQKGQRAEGKRAHTARAKQHVKTAKPKAKVRKHK